MKKGDAVATTSEWIQGARLRTLPAAIAPVLAGSAIALKADGFRPLEALLALLVALSLQVGVNYANDYSDGIRGTDADRIGPLRLVGSRAASAASVKFVAFACFGLAAITGLALVMLTAQWWLLGVGVACILSAWYYTGGRRPYGYSGLGEVFVFVFFGLVATAGTTYVQLLTVPVAALLLGVFAGALASAVLVANNLRDLAGDRVSGKQTLAVRLGDGGTRRLYVCLVVVGAFGVIGAAAVLTWWLLLGLLGFVLVAGPVSQVARGASGSSLIQVLKLTGLAEVAASVGIVGGAVIG